MKIRSILTSWRGIGTDAGEVKIVLTVMPIALLAVFGLVVDGGGLLQERMEARWAAQGAGRAAAQSTNADRAMEIGVLPIDPEAARRAASEFLAQNGYRGTVEILGPDRLRVTAIGSYDPIFWPDAIDAVATSEVILSNGS